MISIDSSLKSGKGFMHFWICKLKLSFAILFFCAYTLSAQDSVSVNGLENLKLLPVLWHQHSAEYRALCYQAFNIAECRLHETRIKKRQQYAIITDVDETLLDNSYYEAQRILHHSEFDQDTWKVWTSAARATAIPGALEFLQLARKKGVRIFYVSNRDTTEVEATILNLSRLGFPDADRDHMLFLKNTSSKEERRKQIVKSHRVIMMLGDNLNDFAQVFEKKDVAIRARETDDLRKEWGKTFIVLPNVSYGEWENAFYNYKRTLSPTEKEVQLKQRLLTDPPK